MVESIINYITSYITNNIITSILIFIGVTRGIGIILLLIIGKDNKELRWKMEKRVVVPIIAMMAGSFIFAILRYLYKLYTDVDTLIPLIIGGLLLLILLFIMFVVLIQRILMFLTRTLDYEEDQRYKDKVDAGIFFIIQVYYQYIYNNFNKHYSFKSPMWQNGNTKKLILLLGVPAFIFFFLACSDPKFFLFLYLVLFITCLSFYGNLFLLVEYTKKNIVEYDDEIVLRFRQFLKQYLFIWRGFPLLFIAVYKISTITEPMAAGPEGPAKGLYGIFKMVWSYPVGKATIVGGLAGIGAVINGTISVRVRANLADWLEERRASRAEKATANNFNREQQQSKQDFDQKNQLTKKDFFIYLYTPLYLIVIFYEYYIDPKMALVDSVDQSEKFKQALADQSEKLKHALAEQSKQNDHVRAEAYPASSSTGTSSPADGNNPASSSTGTSGPADSKPAGEETKAGSTGSGSSSSEKK
jgi:hypothetical protein